jgi:hypothetical protein
MRAEHRNRRSSGAVRDPAPAPRAPRSLLKPPQDENKLDKHLASSAPLALAPSLDLVRLEYNRPRGLQFYDGQQQRFPPCKRIAFLGSVPALISVAEYPLGNEGVHAKVTEVLTCTILLSAICDDGIKLLPSGVPYG